MNFLGMTVEATNYNGEESAEDRAGSSDAGAVRMLLEGNYLFDVVDLETDFIQYKVIILPDCVSITERLASKLSAFIEKGGKLLATGTSGLNAEQTEFAIDLGVSYVGVSPYQPEYFHPQFELKSLPVASFIFYSQGQLVESTSSGTVLGHREFPYFNRDVFRFCSHQHTPSAQQDNGAGMVESVNGIYIAWSVFEDYATKGSLVLKETVMYALDRLLAEGKTLHTDLPAQGIVTLMEQPQRQRFETAADGKVSCQVPKLECHQMVVLEM
jgi:hypothetical protein